jgi:heme exporter protein D
MNWSGWSEFLAMGGRGFFVWGSYLVTFAVVVLEVALVLARRRRALAAIRDELESENEAKA